MIDERQAAIYCMGVLEGIDAVTNALLILPLLIEEKTDFSNTNSPTFVETLGVPKG